MSVCPCCQQEMPAGVVGLPPTTEKARVRQWLRFTLNRIELYQPFTQPEVTSLMRELVSELEAEQLAMQHPQSLSKLVTTYIQDLVAQGQVEIVRPGKPGKPYLYRRVKNVVPNQNTD